MPSQSMRGVEGGLAMHEMIVIVEWVDDHTVWMQENSVILTVEAGG